MGPEHSSDVRPPLAERLRARGMRLTPQRQQVLAAVNALEHGTPEDIAGRLRQEAGPGGAAPDSSTVYRTLELLVKSGMVRRVHLGEDHYHYEHVRGDSHHDHLICTTCGSVIEFVDEDLERRQREICERKRFMPTFHNLQILGVCESCRKKGEQPDAPDRVKMIGQGAMKLRQ